MFPIAGKCLCTLLGMNIYNITWFEYHFNMQSNVICHQISASNLYVEKADLWITTQVVKLEMQSFDFKPAVLPLWISLSLAFNVQIVLTLHQCQMNSLQKKSWLYLRINLHEKSSCTAQREYALNLEKDYLRTLASVHYICKPCHELLF